MITKVFHSFLSNNIICFILFLQFHIILDSKDVEDYVEPKQEQVVVRAVFLNCEDNQEDQGLSPASRFQREELFKHCSLQGCRKKLAITLKLSNEAENTSGDEYIPIEHVFDGPDRKRVRLLDPYILRLKREAPLQAYKLQLIETVKGLIAESEDRKSSKTKRMRIQRKSEDLADDDDGISKTELSSSTETESTKESCELYKDGGTNATEGSVDAIPDNKYEEQNDEYLLTAGSGENVKKRVKRDVCTVNSPEWKRARRNEHNIIVEDTADDEKIPILPKSSFYQKHTRAHDPTEIMDRIPKIIYEDKNHLSKKKIVDSNIAPHSSEIRSSKQDKHHATSSKSVQTNIENNVINNKIATPAYDRKEHVTHRSIEKDFLRNTKYDTDESSYVLYEIGKPDLWYSVQVQLFEKMSTPEGKTAWNDITNGEIASVSSLQPEWKGQDFNVKYKPSEWVSKDKFSLPVTNNLGLLVSTRDDSAKNSDEYNDNSLRRFIVVPMDDIVNLESNNPLSKRDENHSQFTTESIREEQSTRRVLIRASRALVTGTDDDMKVSSVDSEHFLLMPYKRPHHAQIDLEARADDNELIRVGSSGSLTTIVSDNSRRVRSTITVQATNKGLAAARFSVKTRDCGPELTDLMDKSGGQLMTGPVLIAPRHTHRFVLELPVEIPSDIARCSVALVNDEDESVAVREVEIKKGDRCFCVWHCDCVCLNEDPKLLCREMAEARQTAAGLSPRGRPRRARFACYPDMVYLNMCVVFIGVIFALLFLGLVKAVLGTFFRCVALSGLHRLVQTPRRLEYYYEENLKDRCVIYDDDGWPVHPDTMQRTVRFLTKEMEFALNVIFFIAVPSIMLWEIIRCPPQKHHKDSKRKTCEDSKKCFSTHDMQGKQHRRLRRRNVGLEKWMTKPAEELTTDIWSRSLNIGHPLQCELMLPLLAERQYRPDEISSCVDSEQDDTEYVLTQMQKSKESLAKSQRKINESGPSTTVTKQLKAETK